MAAGKYGDLKVCRLEITGETSFGVLMHNPAGLAKRKENTGVGPKILPTPEEEAEVGAYRMSTGQLYLPSNHFRGSLLNAAKGQKINKKSTPLILAAAVFAIQSECPLYDPRTGDPISEYEIDIQRAVIQKQGISRARPNLHFWATVVEYQYEPLLVNPDILLDVQTLAGATVGVGDYRPEKKGPYGRYSVELVKG